MVLHDFISKLDNNEPFTFTRWGDGEWSAIFDTPGCNTDGHEYFRDMNEALRTTLEERPEYFLGIQNHALRNMGTAIEGWLKFKQLTIEWVNADVFHHASIKGHFAEFVDALSPHSIIMVGPNKLRGLFKGGRFVEVPEKNCWLERKAITSLVETLIKNERGAVVLFCASMASNVIIHELYKLYGKQHTFLDMGSVFMPYVGVANRSYHKAVIERLKTNI